jgi:PAS domain S-box-containing protein
MVAFLFWDINGEITDVNDRFLEITGYTRQDLQENKIRWKDITPPEYAYRDEYALKQIALTGICDPFEKEYIRKDGSRIPILIGAASIEEGNSEKGVAYITDISQRKKTEDEILKINERFKLITRATNDVVWDWDLVNNDLWWNENFYSLFQYDVATYHADINSWYDGIHPDDKERVISKVHRTIRDSESYWFDEYRFLKSDGSVVDILNRGYLVYDKDGKPSRMIGAMMDLAERKRNEQSLLLAEEQYRNIFENTSEGIYQSTTEGQFITANPSMAKMFGYCSPEELISSINNIATEIFADPQERLRVIILLKKQEKINGFEFKALKRDKKIIWVRANIRAIHNPDGSIKYFEGTMEDITDRKVAEDKLKSQFEELQKTNYELDRFVYSVSHDLRAPLASILGIVNISENEQPTPAHMKYLEMIRISVNRLDGFIKEILDYSRNNRTEVVIGKIRFHELIDETLNSLRLIQGTDRLKVSIEIDDNIPYYSDSVRIGIILNNIFSNSIKYQDFRKDLSFLTVGVVTSKEKVVITIRDNGIGIGDKHLDKIFNMFYRASDVSAGSGLGLYIAKETITKLGGDFSVKSKLGIFTTFEIVIPNSCRDFNIN